MTQLPPKKEVALALLERSNVDVYLDPRAKGVVVPPQFRKEPRLILKIGLNMPVPIPDLRLDDESKSVLTQAAALRRISVSDYVRTVLVAQARREVAGSDHRTIVLSPEEQLSFWEALNAPPKLTTAQKRLGELMQGKVTRGQQ